MIFYAKERIGNSRYLTPDEFLLCKDVPLARAGELTYLAQEAPEVTPINGKVTMTRPEESLFSAETIASFNGKPVLNGFHRDVTPDNYQDIAVGSVLNVHRGEGEAAGFLIGDLMIYDRDAIQAVQNGRTEISIGFKSEYRETEAGRGEQSNIIGNHVALVDEGRAGPVCSIGDIKPEEAKEANALEKEEIRTGDSVDVGALGKIVEILKGVIGGGGKEEGVAAIKSDEAPVPAGNTAAEEMAALAARLEKLEALLAKEKSDEAPAAPIAEGDEGEASEEVIVEDEMPPEEVVERAEILSPGIDVPEGDAKDTMPSLKRAAVSEAIKAGGAAAIIIKSVLNKHAQNIGKAPAKLINAAFSAGSEVAKQANNASFSNSALVFGDEKRKSAKRPMSGADLNALYRDAWAKENGGVK
ncbi:hypothetical protein FACS1894216_01090 [Synergistales bacterium]|nr:hypothetical protein FACS1894216_01090 [Synergistales bacterium]